MDRSLLLIHFFMLLKCTCNNNNKYATKSTIIFLLRYTCLGWDAHGFRSSNNSAYSPHYNVIQQQFCAVYRFIYTLVQPPIYINIKYWWHLKAKYIFRIIKNNNKTVFMLLKWYSLGQYGWLARFYVIIIEKIYVN